MNHQWYRSAPVKGILVAVAHLLVVAVAAGIMWIMSYPMLKNEVLTGRPVSTHPRES